MTQPKPQSILVVDDDDALRKLLIDYLTGHGLSVTGVGTATEAVQAVSNTAYSLVLLDLNLPDGDTAASNEPFDVVVPDESLWLLGDNRDRSRDARAHQDLPGGGFVPVSNVVGKAFLTTWPFSRIGAIEGHHEIFNGVPDSE